MKNNNLEILREEKLEHADNVSKSELMDLGFLVTPLPLLPYIQTRVIKPQAAQLYAVLLNFYNEERGFAYPKQADLCAMLEMDETSVRVYSKELEDAGLIVREKHGHSYRYYFKKPGDMETIKRRFPDKYDEYIQRRKRREARLHRDKQRLKEFKESQKEYVPERVEMTPQQAAAAERGADMVAASFASKQSGKLIEMPKKKRIDSSPSAETSNETEEIYSQYDDSWI